MDVNQIKPVTEVSLELLACVFRKANKEGMVLVKDLTQGLPGLSAYSGCLGLQGMLAMYMEQAGIAMCDDLLRDWGVDKELLDRGMADKMAAIHNQRNRN